MSKKYIVLAVLGMIACLCVASAAQAAITYDQSLASPNGGITPGWYNGTGNPNGGFVVSTDNDIEIGLRAKGRGLPAVIHTPNNVYYVQPGFSTAPRAWWNYETSINTRAGGIGTRTLNDITAELKMTDLTYGGTATVDPLTYWTDNTGVNGVGKHVPDVPTDWGSQNSHNPQFGDDPILGTSYDLNASRIVEYQLTVKDKITSAVLATNTMLVVVPEPGSLSLISAAVGGIFLRRRRVA